MKSNAIPKTDFEYVTEIIPKISLIEERVQKSSWKMLK